MIHLQNVEYVSGGVPILSDIHLHVKSAEFVGIVGESGAGKSTLLRLVHMEIAPTRGKVKVADFESDRMRPKDIPRLRRKVGFVFQDFKLLEDRDVLENVAFALWATGTPRRRIKRRAFQVLAEVGLSHKRYSPINRLSGGEQQRVAMARALANEPYVLLADEPTGNLDSETGKGIMDLLYRINRRGTAVLMATHKTEDVQPQKTRIVRIERGRLVQ